LERLRRRADFLKAAKGKRVHMRAFTLQSAARTLPAGGARIGLTVTKKTGGAVERNRIRRRLREALRHLSALPIEPAHDYVIIARREALNVPFDLLQADLMRAMAKVHAPPRSSGKAKGRPRPDETDRNADAHDAGQ